MRPSPLACSGEGKTIPNGGRQICHIDYAKKTFTLSIFQNQNEVNDEQR